MTRVQPYVYGDELDPIVWVNFDGDHRSLTEGQARQLAADLVAVADVIGDPVMSLVVAS